MEIKEISEFIQQIDRATATRGILIRIQGNIGNIEENNGCYRAVISDNGKYGASITMKGKMVADYTCSCRNNGHICRHVAALAYEIKEQLGIDKKKNITTTKKKKKEKKKEISFEEECTSYHIFDLELTPWEMFILCLDAYRGTETCSSMPSFSPDDTNKFNVTVARQVEINQRLIEKGLVSKYCRDVYYWNKGNAFFPKPEYYVDILFELLDKHPRWLSFMTRYAQSDTIASYLMEMCKTLLGLTDKKVELPEFQYYEEMSVRDLIFILAQTIRHHDWETKKVCDALSEQSIQLMLAGLLHLGLKEEDQQYLDITEKYLAVMKKDKTWYSLYNNLLLYRFYFTGQLEPLKEEWGTTPEILYAKAIAHLQKHELDAGIACFDKSFKLSTAKGALRYLPTDPIVTYFYIVALGMRRNATDIKDLNKLSGRNLEIQAALGVSASALVEFFQSNFQPRNTESLLKELNSNVPSIYRMMACIVLHFFGGQQDYKGELPTTEIALLRREAAPFGICPDENWSYEPLLANVHIRPTWELELNDIINNTPWLQAKAKDNDQKAVPETRIVYNFHRYGLKDIRETTRLKNGKWGKGKKLSFKRYSEGDCSFDPIDEAIFTQWRMKEDSYQFPSLSLILPLLKDTDKAFLYDSPLTIREEKVFIYTINQKGNISFATNLPSHSEVWTEDDLCIDQSSDNEWVYYKWDQDTQALIHRLQHLGSIPPDALPLLEKLFTALQGKVEVHSDIAGATAIEQREGQTLLTLRIVPESEMFRATLGLFPLAGGSRMVFPGEGDASFFDAIEGQRFEVNRNLKAELRALKAFNALLIEETDITVPFSARQPETYLSLIDLLNILEIASRENAPFNIEWPEGEPLRIHQAQAQSWDISMKAKSGWFELEGEIPISDEQVLSMGQLLALLREGQSNRFVRLGQNEYLRLSENLRRQLERINAMAQMKGNKVRLPELAMAVAGDSIQGELELNEPKRLLDMRRRIRQSDKLEISIPSSLNATLRDYQEDGFRWMMRLMHWGAGACLADDMGLGKTVQTIACLLAHAQEGAQMVVAPASVVGNWQREVNRFAPSLRIVMLNELALADRETNIQSLGAGDLLILTYGLLVSESEVLTAREWTTVCLDEAHTIKNRDTKSSAAAMRLQATNRIILTGTPIQNHLGELWNLMQFINPGLLGSYDHFSNRFINPIDAGAEEPRLQLRRLVSPFLLRRTKQEVARELPDKVEIQVPVSLSTDEMAIYEVIRRQAKQELEQSSTLSVNTLSLITKLREAACSAALVEKKWKGTSSKLETMLDKLQQMLEEGNRVLIFSQFTSFLDMAQKVISDAGITDFYYLNGSTPMRQRQQMVEGFQRGDKRVFLISLKAGGLGLNLTGANYVIHLDPWWNPAIEQQATDRAYRIGQQQKVTVYHLIAEHTIEEKILRLHDTKRSLADSLLEGSDMSHKMTAEEMLALIEEA